MKIPSCFLLTNANVTVGDWMQYVRNAKNAYGAQAQQTYPEKLKNYVSVAALENYKKRLEDFNPDFKYQMQEFKDGNLLFEMMQRKVWSKASADTAGLLQYYNAHKSNYKWTASADAVLFSCSSETVAKSAMEEIKKGKNWKDVTNENSQVQSDSARYELSQIPVAAKN